VRHASASGLPKKGTDVMKVNFLLLELGTPEKQVSCVKVESKTKYLPRKKKRLKRVNPMY
jgi:hypothetical protein